MRISFKITMREKKIHKNHRISSMKIRNYPPLRSRLSRLKIHNFLNFQIQLIIMEYQMNLKVELDDCTINDSLYLFVYLLIVIQF
jgi:hypothetical protein